MTKEEAIAYVRAEAMETGVAPREAIEEALSFLRVPKFVLLNEGTFKCDCTFCRARWYMRNGDVPQPEEPPEMLTFDEVAV